MTRIRSKCSVLSHTLNRLSSSSWAIREVQVDANTEFVDGDPTDIVIGAKLEAEGYLEGGILFADEVEFWDPDQIEVEGVVTDIASDSEFTLDGQHRWCKRMRGRYLNRRTWILKWV